jgi:hydroxylamine reductase
VDVFHTQAEQRQQHNNSLLFVQAMALLDKANTSAYGNPEMTKVNIGVGKNPGILISGHDLKDMEELLEQTAGTGVDVYTHGEMLPANYYPAFKKYSHFVGNYGNAWWKQKEEFETFNGVILFTTNCIVPPLKDATYTDRIYTTGSCGYPGAKHIPARSEGGKKDFSELIAKAKGRNYWRFCTPSGTGPGRSGSRGC